MSSLSEEAMDLPKRRVGFHETVEALAMPLLLVVLLASSVITGAILFRACGPAVLVPPAYVTPQAA